MLPHRIGQAALGQFAFVPILGHVAPTGLRIMDRIHVIVLGSATTAEIPPDTPCIILDAEWRISDLADHP